MNISENNSEKRAHLLESHQKRIVASFVLVISLLGDCISFFSGKCQNWG